MLQLKLPAAEEKETTDFDMVETPPALRVVYLPSLICVLGMRDMLHLPSGQFIEAGK